MPKIVSLFEKDIHREINGVIKVGQDDDSVIEQELDEYVITSELDKYFRQFYQYYDASIQHPTDKIGVWISGFFGSGKSHFLKILSYLLENRQVADKTALDFFNEKITDEMIKGAMANAARIPTDVILFNIDSKADASSKSDKEAVVKVLLKVFNEKLGYFGNDAAIADFERKLDEQGKYDSFQAAFEQESGQVWTESRDALEFVQDDIVAALQQALGMTEDSANNLVTGLYAKDFQISVEDFAKTIQKYLDSKGKTHRVVFMVDEVGQYIGENSDLMLNLQTVSEDLGTFCGGRAWIVVTSQEDIDAVTKGKVKAYDFSKIQGRYKNRISLSSANTDEVIRLRLLEKNDGAVTDLEALYEEKKVVLDNLIRFTDDSADMPKYRSAKEFAESYPFVPYQFKLLQQVFTQVREMGSSGKHLASGERSMLDAFQLAAKSLSSHEVGQLAPFYTFYLAIEGFLDGSVTRVIDSAKNNDHLEAFDIDLLKTLFMIRYVKEIHGNIENLTTLCLTEIDQDRISLRDKIKESLKRLERQTLIETVGEHFLFLTNEEQDIGRELKTSAYDPDPSKVTSELQQIIWGDIYTAKQYSFDSRHGYKFNRKFDEVAHLRQDGDIDVHVVLTSLTDIDVRDDANVMARTSGRNEVLIRLRDNPTIMNEASDYVRTNDFVSRKNSPNLTENIKRILQSRQTGNQERKKRLKQSIEQEIIEADIFVKGTKLEHNSSSASDKIDKALERLIQDTYSKLGYIRSAYEKPEEIESVFRDGGNVQADGEGKVANQSAQDAIAEWLAEQDRYNSRVTLRTLTDRFTAAPFGWAEYDIVGVLAELVASGKTEVRHANGFDPKQQNLVRDMLGKSGLDKYTVVVTKTIDAATLKTARNLAKVAFEAASVPNEAQQLHEFYKERLASRLSETSTLLNKARGGNYPYIESLEKQEKLLKQLTVNDGMANFFAVLQENEDDFDEAAEDFQAIESFFKNQSKVFDNARNELSLIEQNKNYIDDAALLENFTKAQSILAADDPSKDIPKLGALISPITAALDARREAAKAEAQAKLASKVAGLETLSKDLAAEEADKHLASLKGLKAAIGSATSIDAAIALNSRMDAEESSGKEKLVAAINQKAQASGSTARQIATIKVTDYAPKKVLVSQADVDDFLKQLGEKLSQELSDGKDIHLE